MKPKSTARRKSARKKPSARKSVRVRMTGSVLSFFKGTHRSVNRVLSSIGKAVW